MLVHENSLILKPTKPGPAVVIDWVCLEQKQVYRYNIGHSKYLINMEIFAQLEKILTTGKSWILGSGLLLTAENKHKLYEFIWSSI